MRSPVRCEWNDVQGTVVSGYRRLIWARYFVIQVVDAARARGWLAHLLPMITAAEGRHKKTAINLALTCSGITTLLDLGPADIRNFNGPFVEGMTGNLHRMRILGDIGDNDPLKWTWGGPSNPRVDLLLTIYGETKAAVDVLDASLTDPPNGFDVLTRIETYRPTDREPFGFADGLSQPLLEGTRPADENPDSRHAIRLGEILAGYPDNDEVTEPIPCVKGFDRFGLNGTYLVARQLAQDVKGFWVYMEQEGQRLGLSADALAEKVVGRTRDGAPLLPDGSSHGCAATNEFGFMTDDRHGGGCPLGSHIRRGNPRDMLGDTTEQSWRIVNRHRLLRRGRPYCEAECTGTPLGLLFVGLNADIERQFEFVQQNWINDAGFGELRHERDPLIGYQSGTDNTFTMPGTPLRKRVHNMKSFVKTEGGAYFFLPSLRAIAHLAGV